MDKKSNTNWLIIAAAGAVVIGGVVAYLFLKGDEPAAESAETVHKPAGQRTVGSAVSGSSSTTSDASERVAAAGSGADAGDGSISKELLITILSEMADSLEAMKSQLEAQVQDMIVPNNGDMAKVMQQYHELVAENLQKIEAQVQAKYNVSQIQLLQAQTDLADDDEVKIAMNRIKVLFFGEEAAPAPEQIDLPEDMTADKFYECLKKHIKIVDDAFQAAVEETERDLPHADGPTRIQHLQSLILRRLDDVNAEALETIGLDETTFQGCLMKYSSDQRFMRLVLESQRRQEAARKRLMEGVSS